MSKRQWIWLIAAVAVFALTGVASVAVNTWRERTLLDVYSSIAELYEPGTAARILPDEPYFARVDIEGTILSDGTLSSVLESGFRLDYTLDYIERLMNDENNAGILLYIDSGGGEIKASDEVYLKLMDYKAATGRPIYAYMDGTGCSGAYYIAMAADSIWANRNCICVNIGVYISTYNLTDLFEKYGIEEILIKSSENKAIGSLGHPWTEEQLAIYQSIVDLWYDQFVGIVAEGRGMTKEQVRALDDGREMLASQALEAGFIDGICRYEEYETYLRSQTGMTLYREDPNDGNLLADALRSIYGAAVSLVPRSEAEIVRDFVQDNSEIRVMAYAGY